MSLWCACHEHQGQWGDITQVSAHYPITYLKYTLDHSSSWICYNLYNDFHFMSFQSINLINNQDKWTSNAQINPRIHRFLCTLQFLKSNKTMLIHCFELVVLTHMLITGLQESFLETHNDHDYPRGVAGWGVVLQKILTGVCGSGFHNHTLGYGDRGPKSYLWLQKMSQNNTLDNRKCHQSNHFWSNISWNWSNLAQIRDGIQRSNRVWICYCSLMKSWLIMGFLHKICTRPIGRLVSQFYSSLGCFYPSGTTGRVVSSNTDQQGWGQVLFEVLESSTSTFSYLQVQVQVQVLRVLGRHQVHQVLFQSSTSQVQVLW